MTELFNDGAGKRQFESEFVCAILIDLAEVTLIEVQGLEEGHVSKLRG